MPDQFTEHSITESIQSNRLAQCDTEVSELETELETLTERIQNTLTGVTGFRCKQSQLMSGSLEIQMTIHHVAPESADSEWVSRILEHARSELMQTIYDHE